MRKEVIADWGVPMDKRFIKLQIYRDQVPNNKMDQPRTSFTHQFRTIPVGTMEDFEKFPGMHT